MRWNYNKYSSPTTVYSISFALSHRILPSSLITRYQHQHHRQSHTTAGKEDAMATYGAHLFFRSNDKTTQLFAWSFSTICGSPCLILQVISFTWMSPANVLRSTTESNVLCPYGVFRRVMHRWGLRRHYDNGWAGSKSDLLLKNFARLSSRRR